MTHPPAGPSTPPPPPGPKHGATLTLPRATQPDPTLPPGAPHPDAPPRYGRWPARPTASLIFGSGLAFIAAVWVLTVGGM